MVIHKTSPAANLFKRHSFLLRCFLFALPSLAGLLAFYVVPYLRMLYMSMQTSSFGGEFAGLYHYIQLFQNELFRMALGNAFLFALISTVLAVFLSLLVTLLLIRLPQRWQWFRHVFLFPILAPSVAMILIWRAMFGDVQLVNSLIAGLENGFKALLPLYALFIWKNAGYCIILLLAAISRIPKSVVEAADLDGASGFQRLRHITLPLISPVLFFTAILMTLFSLRIFRESALYYQTAFPPDAVYSISYFINNHFNRLDYQRLSAASVIFSLIVLLVVSVGYRFDKLFAQSSGGVDE